MSVRYMVMVWPIFVNGPTFDARALLVRCSRCSAERPCSAVSGGGCVPRWAGIDSESALLVHFLTRRCSRLNEKNRKVSGLIPRHGSPTLSATKKIKGLDVKN